MTEKQMNEQLVMDINRIFTVAGVWASWGKKESKEASGVCKAREHLIVDMLNANKEAKILTQIQQIEPASYKHMLTKTYINSVIKLLQCRIKKTSGSSKHRAKLPEIKIPAEAYSLNAYADAAAQALKSAHGDDTVAIGYRALEIAGSPKALSAVMCKKLGRRVFARVHYLPGSAPVYRTKELYYSCPVWYSAQMLPVVTLTVEY